MKKYTLISLLILSLIFKACQPQSTGSKELENFHLSDVELLPSAFLSAQQADKEYMMTLDADRLLAPYLIDAGIEPKAERYTNWENTGLDGHTGGHLLSALSMMYASTGDKEVLDRLNYMVDELEKCQQKNGNGYVGGVPGGQEMWQEIAKGNIDAGNFSLNGKWVPLYNIHKIYAGLRDAYWIGGVEKAKGMLVALTDWMLEITSNLTDEQIQDMLISEHGGLNEVFADVSVITGDKKYLELAKKFSDQRILSPLTQNTDSLTGLHANTQIPKVIGFNRVGELGNDDQWTGAAAFFWSTVVNNRSISIGGNSVREHFNPMDDFSSMIEENQGPETCNTYNMLRLSNGLFLSSMDAKYMDFYERGLYNHILSSQHPDGGFVYFTPMRPRHYRVYSQPHEDFWCCVGSGLENHAKYGEMIYSHTDTDLYVNLFIPSKLNWKEKGLSLTQNTDFPNEEVTEFVLALDELGTFSLNVRHPEWVKKEDFKVEVNGEVQDIDSTPSSYASISRDWEDGDKVTVYLPMNTSLEYLPDGSGWVSFVHGPIVLGAVTDSTDLDGLFADDSRMGHVASDELYPLDEAPVLVANNKEEILAGIEKIPGSTPTLKLSGLIYPEDFNDVKLVPFYNIHEARYMVYWPVLAKGDLDEHIATLKEKERVQAELEALTVDMVALGEQQPEAEHGFKGERTYAGLYQGKFWRSTRAWFSYELRNPGNAGKVLRVTLFGGDRDREFDILLDEKLLTTVKGSDATTRGFYEVDYEIPEDLLDTKMTIKFQAKNGEDTRGIFFVRLMKSSESGS